MDQSKTVTAAIMVIGDEILSGRTQDTNSNYIARYLGTLGIDLCEIRVVPDIEDEIVAGVNALRARYTYVFTTGGIGPTHDDITADAIAKAFGVGIDHHPEVMEILAKRFKPGEFNEARQRMARIPFTATLVKNSVSIAPGFQIGNVFVMAGVPSVMRAMMDDVAPKLARGAVVYSATVKAPVGEGKVAAGLSVIQKDFPDVTIGSYPYSGESGFGTHLVARSRDTELLEKAALAIEELVRREGAVPERIVLQAS
jgi:molybdenum cofactor synthesis domain-containing protein